MALKYKWIPQFAFDFIRKVGVESFNRDEQRTPMQWDSSPNAGFCSSDVSPWLPATLSYKERNVATETKNLDSLYHCYRRFLKTRKETPALNEGDMKLFDLEKASKNLLGYTRTATVNEIEQEAYVFLNFSKKSVSFINPVPDAKLLASTTVKSEAIKEKKIVLKPWEGVVLLT
jgi:glycosidase